MRHWQVYSVPQRINCDQLMAGFLFSTWKTPAHDISQSALLLHSLSVWTVSGPVHLLNSLSPLICRCWMDETDPWTLFVYQTQSLVKISATSEAQNRLAGLGEELTGNTKSCVERQLMGRKQSCALLAGQVSFLLWPRCVSFQSDCTHTCHDQQLW